MTYIDLWGLQPAVPQPYIGFALDRPHEYSGFMDRNCNSASNIDVKTTISLGLQIGGDLNKKGAYINIVSADIISLSNGQGLNYFGKGKKVHITQGASLSFFSFEHSFDGWFGGYKNENTTFSVLYTTFSYEHQSPHIKN